MKEEKKLNLPQSLLLLVLIIFSVAVCIRLKTGGPMIGLFASWIFIYLVCKIVRIPYDNVVAGAYDAIRMVVPTLCLLMAIGVMIGTWLQSGTIATIIAWGLKMINPAWLLPLLYFVFYIFYLNLYYAFPTFSIANYIANWYAITFTITSLLSISRFHYVSILMTNTSWLKLQQLNLHSHMFRL